MAEELWDEEDDAAPNVAGQPEAYDADTVASWGAPQQVYGDQDVADWGTPQAIDDSNWNTAGRDVARRGAASVAGVAASLAAMGPGAAGGAALGTAILPGLGTAVGGFVGGVGAAAAAGLGAGWLVQQGQDWVLDKLGLRDDPNSVFNKAQDYGDEVLHPYTKFLTGAAPGLVLLRPNGQMLERVTGAAIGGALTAGSELWQHGTDNLDRTAVKTLMGGALGAALPRANRAGQVAESVGERVATALGAKGRPPAGEASTGTPAPKEPPGGPGLNGEVIPPEQAPPAAPTVDPNSEIGRNIRSAQEQRDVFEQSDPMWKFWDDHLTRLNEQAASEQGIVDVDASLGPQSSDHPFTYQHADRANDITTTAAGVAQENGPAPRVAEAGNPVGAPMQGRIAARPSEPGRAYGKDDVATEGAVETQPSTALSQAPLHEDIAAALAPKADETGGYRAPDAAPQSKQETERVNTAADRMTPEQLERQSRADADREAREVLDDDAYSEWKSLAERGSDTAAVRPEVAPHEQRVIAAATKELREAKMDRALERLSALPPKEQAVRATQLLAAMHSKTGEATAPGSPGEVRMPSKRPELPSGVTARSKADQVRKQGVLDAYEKAAAEHGTAPAGESRGALLDRVARMARRADKLAGGNNYKPREKPPAYSVLQAARTVLKRPTPKNIDAFKAAEAQFHGGKESAEGGYKNLEQETNRIEADIARRPQIGDAASEALINKNAPDTSNRPEYEHFDNSKKTEDANYVQAHRDLVNRLNNLSDGDHALLAAMHPDLELNVRATNDPKELYNNLMDDLAEAQAKARESASFEAVPAENAPVSKRTPIKSRDDLAATEPGKPASPGKSLKGTPEFERLAALYSNKKPKAGVDIDAEVERLNRTVDAPAVDGSEHTLWDSLKDVLADEEGALTVADVRKKFNDWMGRPDQHLLDYGSQIGSRGVRLRTDIARVKHEALMNARASAEFRMPDGREITPAEKGQVYRAAERGETNQLSAPLKAYWGTYWKPVLEKSAAAYDELRAITVRNQFPGWETMPERKTNGPGFMEWMPRRQIRDKANDDYDPITNKSSLSNWTPSAQDREWFVLHDLTDNSRKVYRINEDGKMIFYQNHQAGRARTPPGNFDPTDIGATLTVGTHQMKVDHANIDELMQHGNTDGGKPLKFSDNPGYVITDAYVGLKGALYRTKLLDRILNDPEFAQLSTNSTKVAESRWGKDNFSQTILPQLKGRYFPDPVTWAFDDLAKTGFNYGEGRVGRFMDRVSRFAQATLKPFYFLGPEVHVFNELDKYIVGMGLAHAKVPREVKAFAVAIKSVRAQDALQAEILDAGGNPMFLHALTARVMPQVAKIVGEDLMRQQWKYEPLAKKFGVNLSEIASQLYQDSNKMMWWQSDVLYTAAYLQKRDARMREAIKQARLPSTTDFPSLPTNMQQEIARQAVHDTEHVIDSYVVPTTMGKSNGLEGTGAGRALQKFLTDPTTALFGRFHYGLFSFTAQIVKNLVGVNGMKGMAQGAAQAALMYGMYALVYPALSHLYGQITGNEHSEFEKRGATRFVSTALDVASGKKHDQDTLRNLWTPSTLINMGLGFAQNRDFTGKEIRNLPWGSIDGSAHNAGRIADRVASDLVSPFGTLSRAAHTPGVDDHAKWVAQKFFESNFGLKTSSPGEIKYNNQQAVRDNRTVKSSNKRTGGWGEDFAHWLTRRNN